MKLAVTQPNFLPWLGYFELAARVDLFVVLDTVQLTRRSFIVRNRVLDSTGKAAWITAGYAKCPRETLIKDARMSASPPWWETMNRRIEAAYKTAPHWDAVQPWLQTELPPQGRESAADYNWRLILSLAGLMGLDLTGRWRMASSLASAQEQGTAQERILAVCREMGADSYYNFAGGVEAGLYRAQDFEALGIGLFKQDYRHPFYAQHAGNDFVAYLSVIDLICQQGPEAALATLLAGRNWLEVNP